MSKSPPPIFFIFIFIIIWVILYFSHISILKKKHYLFICRFITIRNLYEISLPSVTHILLFSLILAVYSIYLFTLKTINFFFYRTITKNLINFIGDLLNVIHKNLHTHTTILSRDKLNFPRTIISVYYSKYYTPCFIFFYGH